MNVTRRTLARVLAATAVLPWEAPAQPQSNPEETLKAAREEMRGYSQALAAVKVPMTTEPACHFKP
jgi:hypothetical protein